MEERDGPEPTPAGQVQGVENVVEALLEDEEGGDRKADQRRDDAADFHGSLVLPLDCFWRRLMRVAVAATIASRKRLRGSAGSRRGRSKSGSNSLMRRAFSARQVPTSLRRLKPSRKTSAWVAEKFSPSLSAPRRMVPTMRLTARP